MSELSGNPEQVSEQFGNPEQLPYTPTTEDVKETYVEGRNAMFDYDDDLKDEGWIAEFDRWLAEVKAQEAKAERKRAMSIIMTNIGQIVWQARHNPEGQAIDTSKMLKEIIGIDDE